MKTPSLKMQIVWFLLLTFVLSGIQQYLVIAAATGMGEVWRFYLIMWTPGVVGLFLSWLFGWRWKDIGFCVGPWRYYLMGYAVPAGTAILIFLGLIVTGIDTFELNPHLILSQGSVGKALIFMLTWMPLMGALRGFASGLGEEIGWRGFLHSKMVAANIPQPYLVTGIIWSIWHWPLILFSGYATSAMPYLSLCLFTMMVVSMSLFMGWLREKSGSVFTVALVHGVHNLWIQAIYPSFLKKGELDQYFGGESGVFNAVIYFVLAIYIYKKHLVNGKIPRAR